MAAFSPRRERLLAHPQSPGLRSWKTRHHLFHATLAALVSPGQTSRATRTAPGAGDVDPLLPTRSRRTTRTTSERWVFVGGENGVNNSARGQPMLTQKKPPDGREQSVHVDVSWDKFWLPRRRAMFAQTRRSIHSKLERGGMLRKYLPLILGCLHFLRFPKLGSIYM